MAPLRETPLRDDEDDRDAPHRVSGVQATHQASLNPNKYSQEDDFSDSEDEGEEAADLAEENAAMAAEIEALEAEMQEMDQQSAQLQ